MAPASCLATAPGKLMILGEHAVLHGHPAIVAAVNQRLHVRVTQRDDQQLHLHSADNHLVTPLDRPEVQPWARFLIAVVNHLRPHLSHGLDIQVQADFDSRVGLGSSAAVTVATMAATSRLAGLDLDRDQLFTACLAVVRDVQGTGSGADLAASIYGGVIHFSPEPLTICPLVPTLPLTVIYTGTKASTPVVIAQVEARRQRTLPVLDSIYQAMHQSCLLAVTAIENGDFPLLGEIFAINHGLMQAIGVSSSTFDSMVAQLTACPGIFGAKLSGAGMGDCIIGLGTADDTLPGELLPIQVSPNGVEITP